MRELLIDPLGHMAAEAEALILNASRAELVDKVVEPALREGQLVVCDRFWDATIAYQGFGRKLQLGTLLRLTTFAARGLTPDLTLLLELPVATSRKRLGRRTGFADRLEGEPLDFHTRVAHGYRRLADAQPERFIVIDATRPQAEIALDIRTLVLSRWQARDLGEK